MKTKFIKQKKVAEVGTLNENETIVQEIHVNEAGDEIPFGNRFVVNNSVLSDERLRTYEEISLEKIKKEYDLQHAASSLRLREMRNNRKAIEDRIRSMNAWLSTVDEEGVNEAMEHVRRVLTGEYKFAFYNSYSLRVLEFEKAFDGGDDLKMLSLFSRDGDLLFKVNQYRDGSGSWEDVQFAESEEDLVAIVKAHVLADKFNWTEAVVKFILSHEFLKADKELQAKVEEAIDKLIKGSSDRMDGQVKRIVDSQVKYEHNLRHLPNPKSK